jgi:hypothetical protein
MFPGAAGSNRHYGALRNTEHFSDLGLVHALISQTPDCAYLFYGQLCVGVIFASKGNMTIPSSGNHIARVILWGSGAQMVWIAAYRIVATMQYVKPFGDGAVMILIGNAMSVIGFMLMGEYAITATGSPCLPGPTLIRRTRSDARQECFGWVGIKWFSVALAGCGMILHVVSPPKTSDRARDVDALPGYFYSVYSCNYSTFALGR